MIQSQSHQRPCGLNKMRSPQPVEMAGAAGKTSSVASSGDKIQTLLRWCQAQTDCYPGVKVTNFTSSFRDGLAFCAILHRYRPDLIDFHSLQSADWLANNQLAFRAAESVGIPALLDAEDMATPEKLSIITYVAYMNMHLRGKDTKGGPTVNMFSSGGTQQQQQQQLQSGASVVLPESSVSASSIAKKPGTYCAICDGDVFLLQRAVDTSGRLCHRQCLLDSRRGDLRRAATEALEKRRRCDNVDNDGVGGAAEAPSDNRPQSQIAAPFAQAEEDFNDADLVKASANSSSSSVVAIPESAQAKSNSSEISTPPDSTAENAETSAPADSTAANAETSAPADSTAANAETSAPADSTAANAETSAPADSTAANTETSAPADSIAANVESSAPVDCTNVESSKPADSAANPENSAEAASSQSSTIPARISALSPNSTGLPVPPAASSPFGSPTSTRRSSRKAAPAPPPPSSSKLPQPQLARSATSVSVASANRKKMTVDVDHYPEEFNPFSDISVPSAARSKPPPRPPPATRSGAPSPFANATYPEDLNPFGEWEEDQSAANLAQQQQHSRRLPPQRPPGGPTGSVAASVSLPVSRCSSMEPLHRAASPGPGGPLLKSFRKSRHAPPPPSEQQKQRQQRQQSPMQALNSHVNQNSTPKSASTVDIVSSVPVSAQASPQDTPSGRPGHPLASDLHHRSSSRLKGPAPPRPNQTERRVIVTEAVEEFEALDAIERELAVLGERQAQIESRGRDLYDKLKKAYGYGTLGYNAELDQSDAEEPLLLEWINLVNERNRLCREELYLLRRSEERELELQHSSIEFDLRRVMSKQEALKTESDKELERNLLAQLTEVVNKRAKIIDLIDASQREQEEQEQLLAATLATASASVHEKTTNSSKKENKKLFKLHKKEEKDKSKKKSKLASKLKKKPPAEDKKSDEEADSAEAETQRQPHQRFKLFGSLRRQKQKEK